MKSAIESAENKDTEMETKEVLVEVSCKKAKKKKQKTPVADVGDDMTIDKLTEITNGDGLEDHKSEKKKKKKENKKLDQEDENRRNAPLTAENATRVIEAMRGVSFGRVAPDWVAQAPEDRWIDQLRRLRQSPNT